MARRVLVVVATAAALASGLPGWASPAEAAPAPAGSGGSSAVETIALAPTASQPLAMTSGSPTAATTGARAEGIEPFSMLGVSWDGPVGAVRLRVRSNGSWGAWLDVAVEDEHAPDPGTTEPTLTRPTSAPTWVGRADGYELVLPAGVAAPEVHLVRDTGGTLAATAAPTPPDGKGSPGAPLVHRRSSWSARPATQAPVYADELRMVFVHHTVNANGYAADDVPRMLRGIQAYHMDANGWSDIGYNLLIDRFGRVWEGRPGGLNRPVIGAHTGGFNTNSVGVALLGDFRTTNPASAAVQALTEVIGWRLGSAGVSPLGTATMTSRGANDRYPVGTVVQLPTVAGHRDGKTTDCPGDRLYAQLPEIRRRAAALAFSIASPFGAVDRVTRVPGGVDVQGWAIDSQADGSIPVHVQVDGVTVTATSTGAARPDVGAVFPGHGTAVGYRVAVPVPPGSHDVCPIALNVGYGFNRNLGCRRVTIATRPFGALDVVQPSAGGIFVAGWTIDPDVASPIAVHVYVDTTSSALTANSTRTDVGAAFPPYGSEHGYSGVVPAGSGRHQVCAYGINTSGAPNTTLGCKSVTVP